MFSGMIDEAKAAVQELLARVATRAAIGVVFMIAIGFAIAALTMQLVDRFGELPPASHNLLRNARLRLRARRLGVRRLDALGIGYEVVPGVPAFAAAAASFSAAAAAAHASSRWTVLAATAQPTLPVCRMSRARAA